MSSDVDICNIAAVKLGGDFINSFDDDSKRARIYKLRYPQIRDAEIRKRRWKCTIRRASLAADVPAPIGDDFALQYTLPADSLRVIQIWRCHVGLDLRDYRERSSSEYSIEGLRILTNFSAPLFVRYLARVDEGLFDACLSEVIGSRIAYECCEALTQSDSKKDAALRDYRFGLNEGVRAGALERPPESIADDTWIMARTS